MKWIRRIGIVLGVLVLVVVVGAASVYAMTQNKLGKRYNVPAEPALAAVSDSASLARGEHVATALAKCVDCHGDDLGGGTVIDDPAVAHVEATNLTAGQGGVLSSYDDVALERAIRHGVGSDGRNLLIMPSKDYHNLSDDDVAALIAYIRSRPAVSRTHQASTIGPVIRMLWATGKADPTGSAVIKHDDPHAKTTPVGNTEVAGQYIAVNGCAGCHGDGYSGGPIPGTPPDWKPAANLTPTGIGRYSLADFQRILREGKRPDGSVVDSLMPVRATSRMTDEEIEAVYKFLKTVPAKEFGNR
jgi:mono/diheme cytochrome c family protein